MNEEIRAEIEKLGELIKKDARYSNLTAALDEYERNEELISLIDDYNREQDVIITKVSDKEAVAAVQAHIDELYDRITSHPAYLAYFNAKEEFDRFTGDIFRMIQYAVTGQSPCTHDCSSCGGCG